MKRLSLFFTPIALVAVAAAPVHAEDDARRNWPTFRGPDGTGYAPMATPPVTWGESENIRWKVAVPGLGHASPIVWGDRVYVLSAMKTDRKAAGAASDDDAGEGRRGRRGRRRAKPSHVHSFVVMALDRATGKTIWKKTVHEEVPHEAGHPDASQASASPVTDGEVLLAHFGSRGLYCLDLSGKVQWKADLGDMKTRNEFGEGSSPAINKDTVVVNWDHEGPSFIIAFDKATGKERWRRERDEPTSWSTPLIVDAKGGRQVVVSATNFIRGYDLKSGETVWKCGGMTVNAIPSPMFGNGLLYCLSGFRGNALLAIDYREARGDITGSDKSVWRHDDDTPYVPSGMLYGDKLYCLNHNRAMLSAFDAKTGKQLYRRERLEGVEGVYASLVGADGRIYIAGRNGATAVVQHGDAFKVLSLNRLDDHFDATPALAGDEIFLRGRDHLYCIAESPKVD